MELLDKILLINFAIALIFGAAANKTNFCTMGAVSDWMNMGQRGRLWAWFLAIAVAMIAVTLLETMGVFSVTQTIPPYRTSEFAWLRYLIGGFVFGIGMTLGSGCGNKTLVNIGNGSLKSLLVMAIIAITAYIMNTGVYESAFHWWINAPSIELASHGIHDQSLHSIVAGLTGLDSKPLGLIFGLGLGTLIIVLAFRSPDFRRNKNNLLGGLIIGLCITAGWYITGGPMGQELIAEAEWMDERPYGIGVQSYTFITPLGDTTRWVLSGADKLMLTFGVVAILGVPLGSLIYALISKRFRFIGFANWADFGKHVVAGVLMGIGGLLSMGCTIGQGITGSSTLALGSFMVVAALIFGSALTMKVQFYQMMYDEEATFMKALLSSLVDMRLLPEKARKLERP